MSEEHSQPVAEHPDPATTIHELVNVLAAVQIHVYMARRICPRSADPDGDARPASDPGPAAPATPSELLTRLESMVDRALELATELDEQVRIEGLR